MAVSAGQSGSGLSGLMIEAVIALPRKLYSTTSTAVSLLVLSKNNKSIRMIDAGTGELNKKGEHVLSSDVATEIVSLMEMDADNSVKVLPKKMEYCDYVVTPSRYLNAGIEIKGGVEFGTIINNMTRGIQMNSFKLEELASEFPTDIQYLLLTGIQDGIISDKLPYLKRLDRRMEKYCIKDNSLIISKNGPSVKIAVASVRDGHKFWQVGICMLLRLMKGKQSRIF